MEISSPRLLSKTRRKTSRSQGSFMSTAKYTDVFLCACLAQRLTLLGRKVTMSTSSGVPGSQVLATRTGGVVGRLSYSQGRAGTARVGSRQWDLLLTEDWRRHGAAGRARTAVQQAAHPCRWPSQQRWQLSNVHIPELPGLLASWLWGGSAEQEREYSLIPGSRAEGSAVFPNREPGAGRPETRAMPKSQGRRNKVALSCSV